MGKGAFKTKLTIHYAFSRFNGHSVFYCHYGQDLMNILYSRCRGGWEGNGEGRS